LPSSKEESPESIAAQFDGLAAYYAAQKDYVSAARCKAEAWLARKLCEVKISERSDDHIKMPVRTLGHSSLGITIPAEIARDLGIRTGDVVEYRIFGKIDVPPDLRLSREKGGRPKGSKNKKRPEAGDEPQIAASELQILPSVESGITP